MFRRADDPVGTFWERRMEAVVHMDRRKLEAATKPDDVVVFIVTQDTRCDECGSELAKESFLRVEDKTPLCLDCADLGELEFLPSGDAALTRRASKHSPLKAVVVQWSRRRKRYERRGTLVTPAAIEQAEAECAADAPERAKRRAEAAVVRAAEDRQYVAAFAEAVRRHFPGCPGDDERTIAAHACEKYSGRVGRSAAAKELDETAVRLAVVAHVRHVHTDYDRLLDSGVPRRAARERIASTIDRVLARWRTRG
jgi:hypothetical protein